MTTVTPNKRGLRSREAVLDAAERVMAERGYEDATLARIVEGSGIPMSSVYHYFKSKDGILLAVLERGAQRFIEALELPDEPLGDAREHAAEMASRISLALSGNPFFLRLLIVFAVQPRGERDPEVDAVIERARQAALRAIGGQIELVTGRPGDDPVIDRLARFALAIFDGAFISAQPDSPEELAAALDLLPDAMLAAAARLIGESDSAVAGPAARSVQ